ncbi:hypothetical protein EMN47_08350 [Prolixibacteraceae bacterium JC049]|nr:hypothetical protein [Prolixibacteraceae bacterium JC049]
MLTRLIDLFALSCKKATYYMMLDQENKLTSIQKFQLNLHFKICKLCRLFHQQSDTITESVIEMAKQCSHHPHHQLSNQQKEEMQLEINKELKNKADNRN